MGERSSPNVQELGEALRPINGRLNEAGLVRQIRTRHMQGSCVRMGHPDPRRGVLDRRPREAGKPSSKLGWETHDELQHATYVHRSRPTANVGYPLRGSDQGQWWLSFEASHVAFLIACRCAPRAPGWQMSKRKATLVGQPVVLPHQQMVHAAKLQHFC